MSGGGSKPAPTGGTAGQGYWSIVWVQMKKNVPGSLKSLIAF